MGQDTARARGPEGGEITPTATVVLPIALGIHSMMKAIWGRKHLENLSMYVGEGGFSSTIRHLHGHVL